MSIKHIIICGPQGSGKTRLAKQMAADGIMPVNPAVGMAWAEAAYFADITPAQFKRMSVKSFTPKIKTIVVEGVTGANSLDEWLEIAGNVFYGAVLNDQGDMVGGTRIRPQFIFTSQCEPHQLGTARPGIEFIDLYMKPLPPAK
jgi:hypothetical protein